jgi:hypothetical protein
MSKGDATLLMPAPTWSDPRVHLLDDTWLLTIFAIVLATALPWAISSFHIDIAGTALGLVGLGAIHVAFTGMVNPARAPAVWHGRALAALHAFGTVIVGFLWHHVGGLQNPAFLLVFTIPVVGAIFLSRWQPYLIAICGIVTVAVVALIEAPELRWYASGLNGGVGSWITAIFGSPRASLTPPFPGLYAPSSYFVVMLEVFAVVMFACAVAAEYLGTVFDRLHEQVLSARVEAERGQELWTALIEQLPLPTLLVDAMTMQVVCASHTVAPEFCKDQSPAAGRGLCEAIDFSFPEVIQELVSGAGGVARLTVIRAGGRLRIADVRVQHMAQRGRRFAIAVLEDRTEAFCVKAALDVADHAALVLDGTGTVITYNKPALALFAGTQTGANVSRLMSQPAGDTNWWEPTLAGRLKMQVEIKQRLYHVTSSALALPGEEERIYVVAFRPMRRGTTTDRSTLTATMVQLS